MEYLLIVNADDFGLSKGQNYGIVEACRNSAGRCRNWESGCTLF